jgi:hypothetical protein
VKKFYVKSTRLMRGFLRAIGVLRIWDKWASKSRIGKWSRSLLSIYDIDELVALDVPWWTFDSIDIVDDFLTNRPAAKVFEWGSGASTIWLSKRAKSVIAIEHDRNWASLVDSMAPANVEIRLVEPSKLQAGSNPITSSKKGNSDLDFSDYVKAIEHENSTFDLIVIDGRAREGCLGLAIAKLSEDGMILFDNVDRARYREAISRFQDQLKTTWTRGLTPGLPYPTRTAVISRRDLLINN